MDYLSSFAVSAAGMSVERTRLEVASLNLANANTVQAPGAVMYQPSRVVARAGTSLTAPGAFGDQLGRLVEGSGSELLALPQVSIEPAAVAPRMVYEPGHPFANERGFVAYSGVDPATEMVSLMTAVRAYEANVAAMNTARSMALRALEIGGGG